MAITTTDIGQLDVPALRNLLRERNAVILDVRSPGEFASLHVEGSHNLPLDLLQDHAADVVQRTNGPIAVLCAQGVRSQQAARTLSAAGGADVHVLAGGIQAWQSAGGEVIRGQGQWAMDRQVRLVAGTLVLTGILTSVVVPRTKWLAAAIGGGLTFSAVTNTCAMGRVLGYLPYNQSGPNFDVETALGSLQAAADS